MPLPNLIIAGVHKAGTTSLFVYLSHHPETCASRIKEIGWFMPLRDGKTLPPLSEYEAYFIHCNNSNWRLEASPGYLYGKTIIAEAIDQACPGSRIIIILRNPADRLSSFYHQIRSKTMMDEEIDFESFVKKSLIQINNPGFDNYLIRGVKEGFYSDYLGDWLHLYGNRLKIVFFDDQKINPKKVTVNITEWLGLDTDVYADDIFTVENKTEYYKNKLLHKSVLSVNKKLESFWRKYHLLKKRLRKIYYLFNAGKNQQPGISESSLNLLKEVFEPYNRNFAGRLKNAGYDKLPAWLTFN